MINELTSLGFEEMFGICRYRSLGDLGAMPELESIADRLEQERDRERTEEIRLFVQKSALYLSIPIFLGLWFMDFIYVPNLVTRTFCIRITSVPFFLFIHWLLGRSLSLKQCQIISTFCVVGNTAIVTALIWATEGVASPYYAGLNLVAFGFVCVPWTSPFVILNILIIYCPFAIEVLLSNARGLEQRVLAVHAFFIAGTILMCLVMRWYMERLRFSEIRSRILLRNEVLSRDRIIAEKTEETIKLRQLATQFSPQIVKAIREGRIRLNESVQSQELCAIFIDIVKSTDRLQVIPISDFTAVISSFIKDATRVLLRHDVTLDKFLGDGILGFSNAPVPCHDYVEKAIHAAVEVKALLGEKQQEYQRFWRHPFDVRIGIAKGIANVGFYGEERIFQSYTAIGEPMNLAARICSLGQPNSLLIEGSVAQVVKARFELLKVGNLALKGFEGRFFDVYDVKGLRSSVIAA